MPLMDAIKVPKGNECWCFSSGQRRNYPHALHSDTKGTLG
jgi:hypothetical protein